MVCCGTHSGTGRDPATFDRQDSAETRTSEACTGCPTCQTRTGACVPEPRWSRATRSEWQAMPCACRSEPLQCVTLWALPLGLTKRLEPSIASRASPFSCTRSLPERRGKGRFVGQTVA